MVAYDPTLNPGQTNGAGPARARQSLIDTLSDKVSNFLDHQSKPLNPQAPVPDYAVDAPGRKGFSIAGRQVQLGGRTVPLAVAVLGGAVLAGLLINKRTRGAAITAAGTAWTFLQSKKP
ncbi:hypothetical protein CFHF_23135 [Caulobacter flavus]|uniref:Uncharacterized protein n=1 Tax=Caulobacter flavus TaxID=1679497 RepID=A0A2N5CMA2_9CAUL|nr:hypothetical protein [Caulobacter flavus]AYV44776.1 hypothetical protein C1707_00020 [Caulobacter flavus]PLR07117.1 hypothetical protein CFHF_23135 [Caulobacter flavus]